VDLRHRAAELQVQVVQVHVVVYGRPQAVVQFVGGPADDVEEETAWEAEEAEEVEETARDVEEEEEIKPETAREMVAVA